MADRSNGDVEIIPPSRSLRTSRSQELTEARQSTPHRANPGGILSSLPIRWEANAQAKSYDAQTRRTSAERALVEADTELGHALVRNVRMRHEFAELPQILATDRTKRQIARAEEIRDLYHRVEIAENRRMRELAEAEIVLTDARSNLTRAHERLTTARTGLLNAEQQYQAQAEHGSRYHELGWKQKIGERELYVEEQEAVLNEHRKRVANAQNDLNRASDEELIQRRAEMNADGVDTREVDEVLARRSNRRGR